MKHKNTLFILLILSTFFYSATYTTNGTGVIDLDNLFNYANQAVPNYINKDNTTAGNPITDLGATLGRVLFYDKNLSSDNSTACASCHLQEFAFSDPAAVSVGVNGTTGRHAMRLINARFASEVQFFWDERAPTLEFQTTQPIQDHAEMGFSGTNGDPDFAALITRLGAIDYYQELFTLVYGDPTITENRMQLAMSQFIRSIQSFDAKYDAGRALAPNDDTPFPNFTQSENSGKNLFLTPPQFDQMGSRVGGGLGCGGCHQAPEFDIDPNSLNNGIVGVIGGGIDPTVTRSPTLRDILQVDGTLNGGLMHTAGNGGPGDITFILNHYNAPPNAPGLDPRLRPGGNPQRLNLTPQERADVTAFLQTLSGTNVYTDEKWSDPFDDFDNLTLTSTQNAYVVLAAKVILEGPYNGTTMDDDIRLNNNIPLTEPYTAMAYTLANSTGGEIVESTVLTTTGNDAIVDWVFVELLDAADPDALLATRSALLQRDGDIVDIDGTSDLTFSNIADGDYYVRIRHRNHLSVRTMNTVALSAMPNGLLDFSNSATLVEGTDARNDVGGVMLLWSGDANGDNAINAADRSEVWNNRNTSGYGLWDVNMDNSCNAADRSTAWNNRNKSGN